MIINGVSGFVDTTPSGISTTLLYTFPNPTIAITELTVNFESGDYTGFIIECQTSTNNPTTGKVYCPLNIAGASTIATAGIVGNYPATRSISSVSNNSIVFGNGYTSAQNSSACIPVNIWGIKLEL